ncbi:tripartite tricarboxylate transporter TctB family protein [Aureimonas sp. SK2]|uniref:tripartite tricarboxylate transporter TctB family protein n=1 Tax=Aureimonas sp. SK2 TaxID=3015992 RepID=UPI0024440320|nr:tripartite tricarboxylate transporter TctB family protein [Aureimonas sp. SK2]
MRLNDLFLSLLVLAFGIAILVSAYGFSPIPGQQYGADTMPKAIGVCTIALGLFMAGHAVISGERLPRVDFADWTRRPSVLFGIAVALALVAFYVAASPLLGFLPAAFVVMTAFMLVRRVRPLVAVPVSALAAVLIHEAFGRLLLVPLPRGEFSGFFW